MYITKNQLKILIGGTCLILSLLAFNNHLQAQNNFIIGIFGYDAPFPGRPLDAPEQGLILGTNSNFIAGCISQERQDEFITFGNANDYQMMLEHDPTSDPVTGPFYPYPGTPENIALWPYICRNDVAQIDCVLIEQFIDNVYATYPNDPGLSDILIGHQGETDDPGHWPFIQYACVLIQENFGDNVRSVVIDNADRYSGSTLENLFATVDVLDVFQFELYPFVKYYEPYPPTDSADFVGDEFQTTIIDNRIISNYNHAWQSLTNSSNYHTKLEMIIQTHRAWVQGKYETRFLRRPTEAEIWLQAFLALSRNFKGIHAYVYFSQQSYHQWGLVNEASPRQVVNPWYSYVSELYDHLSVLGPKLLNLIVSEALTWEGTPHRYIQNITGDTLDGSHRTIEVCIFLPLYSENSDPEHFILINRRCNRDSSGFWVNAFPQYIDVTINYGATGSYRIRDLYSDETYITTNNTFENIQLLAGRGCVFGLSRVFFDISGTALYYDSLAVPDASLTLTRDQQIFIETTNANGGYAFENIDGGEVTVTIEKEHDVADAITAYDAAWVLQHGVGLRDFTPYQMIAGDVSSNNAVTAYDAALILQYTVGLINKFPIMPDSSHFWRFVPEDFAINDSNWYYAPDSIAYSPLISDTTDNYVGVIYGDVTGNWESSGEVLASAYRTIHISLKHVDGEVGEKVMLPLVVDNCANIVAVSFSLEYNASALKALSVAKTTLTESWLMEYDITDGLIKVALAGAKPIIVTSGAIVNLEFEILKVQSANPGGLMKISELTINGVDVSVNFQADKLTMDSAIPEEYVLSQNYPNPFNPETKICYQLPQTDQVTIMIYNSLGQNIRTLVNKVQPAGSYSTRWDGRDDEGMAVASGIYLYEIKADQYHEVKKMLLLR